MAIGKKKNSSKKRIISRKTSKKKIVSKKRPAKVVKKKQVKSQKRITKFKKKTTSKSRKISKKLVVKTSDRKAVIKIKISDKLKKQSLLPKKKILKQSELRLVSTLVFRNFLTNQYALKNIARYSGITAVVLGGIFSLLNMQIITDSAFEQHQAQVAAVVFGESTNSIRNPTPNARITVTSSGDLSDIIDIKITVPYAEKVVILAKSMKYGQVLDLGQAHSIDNSTWQFDWNTLRFDSGEYKFEAVIRNIYGSYNYTDSTIYVVKNIQESLLEDLLEEGTQQNLIEMSESTQKNSTTTNSITDTLDQGVNLLIDSNKSPIDDKFKIESTQIVDEKKILSTIGSEQEKAFVESSESKLHPKIDISISKNDPVSNFATITVRTPSVKSVEIYAIPKNSLVLKFLGLAKRSSGGMWKYLWDTTQTPNGEYVIYTRVKTEFGFTEGKGNSVVIQNELPVMYSSDQERRIAELLNVKNELIYITKNIDYAENRSKETLPIEALKVAYIKSVDNFMETIDFKGDHEKIKETLDSYRTKLDELLSNLAEAARFNDEISLKTTQSEILDLKNKFLNKLKLDLKKEDTLNQVSTYINQITLKLEKVTIRNEEILAERVGEKLNQDSDKDSISDYDEIYLYKTNPFSADSDGDGFVDNMEIQSGYDPNDSNSEALIEYESPREAGIVHEELFEIESITTLGNPGESTSEHPLALITGRGLPNSFVTIYIFSTPIIITVRTDSVGNWRYVFDKKLEDGKHEAYVGITDNVGKIVGKSKPVTFVKMAEAYTVSESINLQAPPNNSTDSSLIESRTLLLAASLAVVSLGLVLILLGFYVTGRKEKKSIFEKKYS